MSTPQDLLAITHACVVTVDAVGTIVNDATIVIGADRKIRAIALEHLPTMHLLSSMPRVAL